MGCKDCLCVVILKSSLTAKWFKLSDSLSPTLKPTSLKDLKSISLQPSASNQCLARLVAVNISTTGIQNKYPCRTRIHNCKSANAALQQEHMASPPAVAGSCYLGPRPGSKVQLLHDCTPSGPSEPNTLLGWWPLLSERIIHQLQAGSGVCARYLGLPPRALEPPRLLDPLRR